MYTFWWGLLVVSALLLTFTLLRNKYSLQWLAMVGMNIVTAALILYFINWWGASSAFHIPLNGTTLATIGILGIPGLILLVTLKMTII